MNHLEPFDYVLALGLVGWITSLIPEMNEALRFLILLSTFVGILVKTWEQVKKSEHFINDVKKIWNRIKRK